MIVENKNVTCESNAVSVARVYIVGELVSRGSYIFGGEGGGGYSREVAIYWGGGGVGSLCKGIYTFYCDIAPLQVSLCGLVPF